MGITLGALSLDEIAAQDLAHGDATRAVNAEHITVAIGAWRQSYDGVAALFLLLGIYQAALVAVTQGRSSSFFCLDDPAAGRVSPSTTGRVLIEQSNRDTHDVSGIEVLRASFEAMAQILEFLASAGYPQATAALLSELVEPAAKAVATTNS